MRPITPTLIGVGFTIVGKVDADHAGDAVIRRSRTGFIVHLNSATVHWFSKKQNSVETSSFGSEFISMKQSCEHIQSLAYKLRMMGTTHEVPDHVYGDNQSVLANTTILESTLKKNSSSLAYHLMRKGVAMDDCRMACENTNKDESDLLTKVLTFGEKRCKFVRKVLTHIYGSS